MKKEEKMKHGLTPEELIEMRLLFQEKLGFEKGNKEVDKYLNSTFAELKEATWKNIKRSAFLRVQSAIMDELIGIISELNKLHPVSMFIYDTDTLEDNLLEVVRPQTDPNHYPRIDHYVNVDYFNFKAHKIIQKAFLEDCEDDREIFVLKEDGVVTHVSIHLLEGIKFRLRMHNNKLKTYLVKDGENVRIGVCVNINRELKKLQKSNPSIHLIAYSNGNISDKILRTYYDQKIHINLFRFDVNDILDIMNEYKMKVK